MYTDVNVGDLKVRMYGQLTFFLRNTALKILHSNNTQKDFPGMEKRLLLQNSKQGATLNSALICDQIFCFFKCRSSDSLSVFMKHLEDGKNKKWLFCIFLSSRRIVKLPELIIGNSYVKKNAAKWAYQVIDGYEIITWWTVSPKRALTLIYQTLFCK